MSNDSTFDTEAFLAAQQETALSTKYVIPPADTEFQAVCISEGNTSLRVRSGDRSDGEGKWYQLDLWWRIDAPDTPYNGRAVKQSFWLDMTEDNRLDFNDGKNVKLGKLLKDLGVMVKGRSWSLGGVVGRPAVIICSHQENADDPENPYCNVARVRVA
jgi:hypothetical protein